MGFGWEIAATSQIGKPATGSSADCSLNGLAEAKIAIRVRMVKNCRMRATLGWAIAGC